MHPSYRLIGGDPPSSPVVLSVPHAGRAYPATLREALRVPLAALTALEDRHVDAVAAAARDAETLLIQDMPRAWVDLNRSEHERDPMLDDGARGGHRSAKVRAGLGLVPRRTAHVGELWRRRLAAEEVEARLDHQHRPYHEMLAAQLARTRAVFGIAVLLDIHSMPPLAAARVVLGDRFGRSAAARFVGRLQATVATANIPCALNTPYAGGYILERHGRPREGVHAIQLELDRSLYLDAALDAPGAGMEPTVRLVRAMIDALVDETGAMSMPAEAAE